MLNKYIAKGRLVKDIKVSFTQSNKKFTNFAIAIDKKLSNEKKEELKSRGLPTADFIDCCAWNTQAEFLEKYCGKGDMILVEGRLEKDSYTNNKGETQYMTRCIVENVELERKANQTSQAPTRVEIRSYEYDYDDLPY